MATPLRFRRSPERWTRDRVRQELTIPLDENLGVTAVEPRFPPAGEWSARRFEVDNGDVALFAWTDDEGYWLGNTETPSALWRTDKHAWDAVPYHVARFAQRELLADLHEAEPWIAAYDYLSWFFLPVLLSKDGRHTTREFFRDHAAGFPDADREAGLEFYESFLRTAVLDEHRYTMASKLGTSEQLDLVRMRAAMGEFNAAWVLSASGYDVTPEIEVTTGHSLDFRASTNGTGPLVEVTRPQPPSNRSANSPVAAVRETAQTKTSGQLERHGGGAVLFVDCTSFRDDQWAAVRGERPEVRHRPAVVYRVRPGGHVEGYAKGSLPLDLDGTVEWVA